MTEGEAREWRTWDVEKPGATEAFGNAMAAVVIVVLIFFAAATLGGAVPRSELRVVLVLAYTAAGLFLAYSVFLLLVFASAPREAME